MSRQDHLWKFFFTKSNFQGPCRTQDFAKAAGTEAFHSAVNPHCLFLSNLWLSATLWSDDAISYQLMRDMFCWRSAVMRLVTGKTAPTLWVGGIIMMLLLKHYLSSRKDSAQIIMNPVGWFYIVKTKGWLWLAHVVCATQAARNALVFYVKPCVNICLFLFIRVRMCLWTLVMLCLLAFTTHLTDLLWMSWAIFIQ